MTMDILVFAVVLLWIVVLIQFGVIFALARQIGVLFERVTPVGAMISDKGPEIGARAPSIVLPNLNGPEMALGGATGRSQLVFFLSTTCPICKSLLPALKSIGRDEAAGLEVIMDRCVKIEYGRLFGELSWCGVNSRVLSSKRPKLHP